MPNEPTGERLGFATSERGDSEETIDGAGFVQDDTPVRVLYQKSASPLRASTHSSVDAEEGVGDGNDAAAAGVAAPGVAIGVAVFCCGSWSCGVLGVMGWIAIAGSVAGRDAPDADVPDPIGVTSTASSSISSPITSGLDMTESGEARGDARYDELDPPPGTDTDSSGGGLAERRGEPAGLRVALGAVVESGGEPEGF